MSHDAWAFLGVLLSQVVILVTVLMNRQQHSKANDTLTQLEGHLNNVEVDIGTDDEDVTIGQRLKRMERTMALTAAEHTRIHKLLAEGLVQTAEEVFKRAMWGHHNVGAYLLRRGGGLGWEVVWINPGYSEITGLNLDQVRQGEFTSTICKHDVERVTTSIGTCLAAEVPCDLTFFQEGSGGWQRLNLRAEPYFNTEGELMGQFGIIGVAKPRETDVLDLGGT